MPEGRFHQLHPAQENKQPTAQRQNNMSKYGRIPLSKPFYVGDQGRFAAHLILQSLCFSRFKWTATLLTA
ncbi:hypothetical protein [Paenibacillus terrae]|uniref:hypothetical protein n=1 Tax=Paenibacillus terrae TaxID=159743 RepID=UPI001F324A89|nr:hypothetical protein [Paenibacillus terrae]